MVKKIKRKKKKLDLPDRCAFCNAKIGDDCEVFTIGAKTHDIFDLSGAEGTVIEIHSLVLDKSIYAMVPTSDSQAKKDGNDMLFMLCSEDCAFELKEALTLEKDLADPETIKVISN